MNELIQKVILAKVASQTAEQEYKKLSAELVSQMMETEQKTISIEGITVQRMHKSTSSLARKLSKDEQNSLMVRYPSIVKHSINCDELWKVLPDLVQTKVSNYLTIKGLGFVDEQNEF